MDNQENPAVDPTLTDAAATPNDAPMTSEEEALAADALKITDQATEDTSEGTVPTKADPAGSTQEEETPIAPVYNRDHPEHGASVQQSFYNADGNVGALVTRFSGTGRKVVQEVRFVGVEVTNFVHHGEAVVVTLEQEVQAVLRRIFRKTNQE
jgi:hypothetical protein